LAVDREDDGATVVTVLPITHGVPVDPASAVEIPLPVKRHLGLDDDRSWIIVDEGNEFLWPGYDLRKLPHSDRYDYGFLPPRFFNQVLESFVDWYRSRRRRIIPRELYGRRESNAQCYPGFPPRDHSGLCAYLNS
jgi:hypothetical protein